MEIRNSCKKQIVVVIELNARECLQIEYLYKQQKKIDACEEEEDGDDDNNTSTSSMIVQNFKFLEPIIKMVEMGFNLKIMYFVRNNFYYFSKIHEELVEYLKKSVKDAQCEMAYSSADLWFQLFKNIENRDIIHIFSSEKLRPPEAALRMLKDKRSEDLLKIHYIGSSFKGLFSKVSSVLNNQIKELN